MDDCIITPSVPSIIRAYEHPSLWQGPYNAICKFSTAQKMKFSIKDFFSKCDQLRRFLRIWSHLMKKSLMEKFIFYAV